MVSQEVLTDKRESDEPMSKHVRDYKCSWCNSRFETLQGARAHEKVKHSHNMPLTQEAYAALQLEKLNAQYEGRSTGKIVRKYVR